MADTRACEAHTRSEQDFEARLLAFINQRLLPTGAVEADTYLFADGLINSMRILDLVAFLEAELGITVRDAEVTMDHFRSPRIIARSFVPLAGRG